MSYEKQNFVDGQTLTAAQLNHMEAGIAAVTRATRARRVRKAIKATPVRRVRKATRVTLAFWVRRPQHLSTRPAAWAA